MYGHEKLIDADDPAIFIAHGTNDRIVPYSQTEALTNRLDEIKHPYTLYPLSGARHGPWERFFSDIVDDKTIFQHSVEFAFKHLKLIEIHPASELLNRHLDITIDQSNNQLTLNYPSVVGFRYFVQSSEDLTSWSTKNTDSQISSAWSPDVILRVKPYVHKGLKPVVAILELLPQLVERLGGGARPLGRGLGCGRRGRRRRRHCFCCVGGMRETPARRPTRW